MIHFSVISGPSCCERRCKSHDPNPLLERFVGIYFVHAAQYLIHKKQDVKKNIFCVFCVVTGNKHLNYKPIVYFIFVR